MCFCIVGKRKYMYMILILICKYTQFLCDRFKCVKATYTCMWCENGNKFQYESFDKERERERKKTIKNISTHHL